jgi:hypothetical protein
MAKKPRKVQPLSLLLVFSSTILHQCKLVLKEALHPDPIYTHKIFEKLVIGPHW